jgi:glycerol-3-phosphate dehydrogenase (NAD(P)+)
MNDPFARLAILGAGAWGTALAIRLAAAGPVTLWARDAARATAIAATRRSPYLATPLPAAVTVTADIPPADLYIAAVPMQHLAALLPRLAPGIPIILACKGLDATTQHLPPELVTDRPAAMLTGPNFAHEVAAGLPAAAVLATPDAQHGAAMITRLATPGFRLYGSADIIGAALGGAAKNVIAIAAGAVIGAGLGENARAALITRGLAEIARLSTALGGRPETTSGLSGLGDLILTCTGTTSRNFSAGLALGQGQTLANILSTRHGVTEGITTAPALLARAHAAGVDMPITEAVTQLLTGRDMAATLTVLMGRALRDE